MSPCAHAWLSGLGLKAAREGRRRRQALKGKGSAGWRARSPSRSHTSAACCTGGARWDHLPAGRPDHHRHLPRRRQLVTARRVAAVLYPAAAAAARHPLPERPAWPARPAARPLRRLLARLLRLPCRCEARQGWGCPEGSRRVHRRSHPPRRCPHRCCPGRRRAPGGGAAAGPRLMPRRRGPRRQKQSAAGRQRRRFPCAARPSGPPARRRSWEGAPGPGWWWKGGGISGGIRSALACGTACSAYPACMPSMHATRQMWVNEAGSSHCKSVRCRAEPVCLGGCIRAHSTSPAASCRSCPASCSGSCGAASSSYTGVAPAAAAGRGASPQTRQQRLLLFLLPRPPPRLLVAAGIAVCEVSLWLCSLDAKPQRGKPVHAGTS